MRWPSVFGDAEYAVVKSRQEKLRKPAQLPFESNIERVGKYTVQKTKSLLNEEYLMWGESEYKELRDLVVSRLTQFNERRGGEPSRMLLTEWKDAESGVWIDENAAENISNPVEKALLGKYKIAFQAGKGTKHLVPVLIPNDCLEALRKLSNSDIRKEAGVNPLNQFLFPYTRKSEDHVSGWHAVNEICKAAKISNKITATKMRHRASTIYSSLEVPEGEREIFYRHMGHSRDMNQHVYQQCPMAVAAITKVGKYFDNLENKPRKMKSQEPHRLLNEKSGTSTDEAGDSERTDVVNFRTKPGRSYVQWKQDETTLVKSHFKEWVEDDTKSDAKGSLPGVSISAGDCATESPRLLSEIQFNKSMLKI
ncbi:uncharacterized protein LOC117428302 [Acipenser ruthenus]|uniref:uncharacterized protein LOC117428302 n=1 Tax=Acipenser ruthenus TaxID=7906 RepID=UPI002741236F|nr:uncharacterized protein LOC117428302 [Acipenser ruthenus]